MLVLHDCMYQQVRLPTLLEEQNTKLVIVDSIAALFRLEATTSVKVRKPTLECLWMAPAHLDISGSE